MRSYKPDFKAKFEHGTIWYEVKGWMDPKSATKIKRMEKYYPNVDLRVIDKEWFRDFRDNGSLIPGWEAKNV